MGQADAESRDLANPDDPSLLADGASRHSHADAVGEGDIPLVDGLAIGVQGAAAHTGEEGGEVSLGEDQISHDVAAVQSEGGFPVRAEADLLQVFPSSVGSGQEGGGEVGGQKPRGNGGRLRHDGSRRKHCGSKGGVWSA
jgi:hypothetical protein